MGKGHQHSHGAALRGDGSRDTRMRLAVVFAVAVLVLVLQLVGGLVSGSLALLADAAHVATDAGGVGLALFAAIMAARPATLQRTFGWQRLEVLAAAVNAALLLAVGGWVLVEALQRLRDPVEVESGTMLLVAVLGGLANLGSLLLLARAERDNLNVRGAYLEVLADLLGSVAVVVAALVIRYTGFERADAVVAVLIAVFIVPRTLRLLREAVDVLLEATPKGVDLAEVREHLLGVDGVVDVHDLHAWMITSGMPVLSSHVVVESGHDHGRVLDQLGACLAEDFDVAHCTFQLESPAHRDHERPVC